LRKEALSMADSAYNWLISCPASDVNYKWALKRATEEELRRAIEELKKGTMNKSRIQACERELRKRARGGAHR